MNTLAWEMHSVEQLSVPVCLHTNYEPNQTLQVFLCGEEVVRINPPLLVRAVWLLHQPGLVGLLKLIYKVSVYSGFPRQGKVNNNGPPDVNKSQPSYMAQTDFPSNLSWHTNPLPGPTFMHTPTQ